MTVYRGTRRLGSIAAPPDDDVVDLGASGGYLLLEPDVEGPAAETQLHSRGVDGAPIVIRTRHEVLVIDPAPRGPPSGAAAVAPGGRSGRIAAERISIDSLPPDRIVSESDILRIHDDAAELTVSWVWVNELRASDPSLLARMGVPRAAIRGNSAWLVHVIVPPCAEATARKDQRHE
jgi:hypothetical protein